MNSAHKYKCNMPVGKYISIISMNIRRTGHFHSLGKLCLLKVFLSSCMYPVVMFTLQGTDTYPTLRKGKSSSNRPWVGICQFPGGYLQDQSFNPSRSFPTSHEGHRFLASFSSRPIIRWLGVFNLSYGWRNPNMWCFTNQNKIIKNT